MSNSWVVYFDDYICDELIIVIFLYLTIIIIINKAYNHIIFVKAILLY